MRKEGILSVTIDVQVAFHDVDMVQVVWHGHYPKYLENARWALMDRLDYGLDTMIGSGYAWPIVDLQVKYLRVARFGDRLKVRASLVEWESRLAINYLVTDAGDGARVARARTVQVAVDGKTGVLQLESPPAFVRHIRRAAGLE